MRPTLEVEGLKLVRSPAAQVSGAVLALVIPLAAAGMMWAARSGGDSPMALKVRPMIIGTGWAAYLGMLGELMSVAALLAIGVVLSWVVGREFTDRTVGSLLALPTPPWQTVVAKVAVTTVWALACGALSMLVALPLGLALGLGVPGIETVGSAAKLATILLLMTFLAMPLAWVSTRLRGYLSGISTLIGLIVVTQLVTIAGAGAWFPYAAPSMWAGMGGPEAAAVVTPLQLSLAIPVGLLGTWAAARRWQRSELV
ncbi:ABC transporter permease [Actinotalea sp. M2MS4P-6]|uniref:ABC transporter permease n=1 Tax=Actinotalea sp. M2MS4P-6 TaxID=2983762 RepID=UPI0021E3F8D8|nr:ABC transporter permease [Actinotalea sp. M2MS4P-6]MCV2392978.1 ABC transporter permease [Actinotalea sp. M2MS4P-6]